MSDTAWLYESSGKSPMLVDVRVPGGVQWKASIAAVFGNDYDPNFGWKFTAFGRLGVGSVGKNVPGVTAKTQVVTEKLGGDKTIGLLEASGKRLRVLPGLFQCGGAEAPTVAYLCLFTGSVTATRSGKVTPSKDATLTLEGFDPGTGKATWRHRVGNLASLAEGNVALKDADNIVVKTGLKNVVLNLHTGKLSPTSPGEVFWCAKANIFKINAPKGVADNHRVGSSFYQPCTENMRPVASTILAQPPALAGATVGGERIYATPTALEAVHVTTTPKAQTA